VLPNEPLIISIHLFGTPRRLLLHPLDSGTELPLLHDSGKDMSGGFSANAPIRDRGPDGAERVFAILPPQR
jgi:hypothetical protein